MSTINKSKSYVRSVNTAGKADFFYVRINFFPGFLHVGAYSRNIQDPPA